MHRIEADLLVPGRGEPVGNGVVVLDGDRIGYAGPASGAPETPQSGAAVVACQWSIPAARTSSPGSL